MDIGLTDKALVDQRLAPFELAAGFEQARFGGSDAGPSLPDFLRARAIGIAGCGGTGRIKPGSCAGQAIIERTGIEFGEELPWRNPITFIDVKLADPAADAEAEVIIFDPAEVVNTGDAEASEFTAPLGVRV